MNCLLGDFISHSCTPDTADRTMDVERDISVHEKLHQLKVTCVAVGKTGEMFATGKKYDYTRRYRLHFF